MRDPLKEIQSAIFDDLRPVRPLPPASHLLFFIAVAVLVATFAGSWMFGFKGWRLLTVLQKVAIFIPVAASAGLLALSLVRQMVPGTRHTFSPALLAAGTIFLFASAVFLLFHSKQEHAFVRNGLLCLEIGVAWAVPPAILFWAVLRRGGNLYPGLTGATAGALAGIVGLAVLEFHCPNLNMFHILIWHIGAVGISALFGLAAGALSPRLNFRRNRPA